MYDQQYPLYHPELEHESCGVGATAQIDDRAHAAGFMLQFGVIEWILLVNHRWNPLVTTARHNPSF